MSDPKLEKIYSILNKIEDENVLYASFVSIKDFVTNKLTAIHKQKEEQVNDLASKISKINGDQSLRSM